MSTASPQQHKVVGAHAVDDLAQSVHSGQAVRHTCHLQSGGVAPPSTAEQQCSAAAAEQRQNRCNHTTLMQMPLTAAVLQEAARRVLAGPGQQHNMAEPADNSVVNETQGMCLPPHAGRHCTRLPARHGPPALPCRPRTPAGSRCSRQERQTGRQLVSPTAAQRVAAPRRSRSRCVHLKQSSAAILPLPDQC